MLEQPSLLQFIIYFSKNYSEHSREKPPNTAQGSLLGWILPALEITVNTAFTQRGLSADHPVLRRLQEGMLFLLQGIALVLPRQIHSLYILWQQEGGLCSINHVEYYMWGTGAQTAPALMGSYGPLKERSFPERKEKEKHLWMAPSALSTQAAANATSKRIQQTFTGRCMLKVWASMQWENPGPWISKLPGRENKRQTVC